MTVEPGDARIVLMDYLDVVERDVGMTRSRFGQIPRGAVVLVLMVSTADFSQWHTWRHIPRFWDVIYDGRLYVVPDATLVDHTRCL